MILRQPVVRAVVSAAELTSEGQVDIGSAVLAFQSESNFQRYLCTDEELPIRDLKTSSYAPGFNTAWQQLARELRQNVKRSLGFRAR